MRVKRFYDDRALDLHALWARLYELYGWTPPGPVVQERKKLK